jgi:hypothetical protein
MAFIGLALLPEPADKCGVVDIPHPDQSPLDDLELIFGS